LILTRNAKVTVAYRWSQAIKQSLVAAVAAAAAAATATLAD